MQTVKTVFIKQMTKDAEGKEVESFVEVPLGDLDVREHPEHKKVLDEAVKTRQKAKQQIEAARKAMAEDVEGDEEEVDGGTSGDEPPAKKKPAKAPTAEVPHIPTVDEILAEMQKRTQAAADKNATEQATRKTEIDNALKKHGLPDTARGILEQSVDPELMAGSIAKSSLTFATAPSGGVEADELAQILQRVDEHLFKDVSKKT